MLPLQLLRRLKRSRNDGAIGDDGQIGARLNNFRLSERDHVLGSRIRRASIGFAIQALMFKKQNRIVAADGGAQQARGIERVGGKNHPQSRSMSKDALAAL